MCIAVLLQTSSRNRFKESTSLLELKMKAAIASPISFLYLHKIVDRWIEYLFKFRINVMRIYSSSHLLQFPVISHDIFGLSY